MPAARAAPAAFLLAALAGCLSEAPRPAEEGRVHPDMGYAVYRFAALASPAGAGALLEEAVSDMTTIAGLDFVVVTGDAVRNSSAEALSGEVKQLASILGIVTAKKYVVLGPKAHEGGAPLDRVIDAYARAGLAGGDRAWYEDSPRAGLRVIVLDTLARSARGAERQESWLADTLRAAPRDDTIIAAAYEVPEGGLATLLAADRRVKAIVVARMTAPPPPGFPEPIVVPPLATGAYTRGTVNPPWLIVETQGVAGPPGEPRRTKLR
jgi:hypothetical protein